MDISIWISREFVCESNIHAAVFCYNISIFDFIFKELQENQIHGIIIITKEYFRKENNKKINRSN